MITLNVIDVGTGPAVLLLHGFPDRATMWRHQIEALSAVGYRVIAPDLRGFGESDRPDGVDAYALEHILGDVTGLLDVLDVWCAAVAAHDWGALVAWALAGVRGLEVVP
ncbi:MULTISPECIES: alpha/beta fold hydrolase [Amycolatopsis]|uniref:AB hydrolase-1 domain-containing protein n=1 Tax=Amycolatopsis tucumanensis TaxID=401106 RepID=A0ABP7HR69_9PSEU|nr:alpha/beta fold hydrolase [Amycolatopsis tucumanensis]MCF6421331.1 alpha/beta hydrolase [Amycolatopsis tucumanensis]